MTLTGMSNRSATCCASHLPLRLQLQKGVTKFNASTSIPWSRMSFTARVESSPPESRAIAFGPHSPFFLLHSSFFTRAWNSSVLRYRSPVSGRITTMSLPSLSGLPATCKAAKAAAPEEMPTRIPSCRASRRAIPAASSSAT